MAAARAQSDLEDASRASSHRLASWAVMAIELPELLVPDAALRGARVAGQQPRRFRPRCLARAGEEEGRLARPSSLTYDQALEEAACFGWIDGQLGRRDESTYRQRFTPRLAAQRLVRSTTSRWPGG